MIPFGKYNGKTIKEVVSKDLQYSQWLITQPWFSIKFIELHQSFMKELNMKLTSESETYDDSFIIYTDGACSNNGSLKARAGLGAHFSHRNKIKINDISEKLLCDKPTNNKAELTAILRALELCSKNKIYEQIIIYTDSDYSIKCITIWYPQWVEQKKLKNRKNIDILHKINQYYTELNVLFKHIRSHTGLTDEHSQGNEIADKLAVGCI